MTCPRRRRLIAGLEVADEILRLLLHLDVTVADDTEDAVALDRIAGKQFVHEQPHGMFDGDVAGVRAGQADETPERGRHDDQRQNVLVRLGMLQRHDKAEALVRDERKRVRRVNRLRRQHRKDLVEEVALQPFAFGRVDRIRRQHLYPDGVEFAVQIRPDRLLLPHQRLALVEDGGERLCRRQTVGGAVVDPLLHLTHQSGDPNHVELIQIVA